MTDACPESRWSISATETLNLSRRRSLRLLTTCLFSFNECECSTRISSVKTPTVGISPVTRARLCAAHRQCGLELLRYQYFRRDPFHRERLKDVANLNVIEVR